LPKLPAGDAEIPIIAMGSEHAVGGFSSPLHIHALRALIQEGTHMTNLKLPRRRFLHLAVGAAALPAVSRIARAQGYPSRPVRLIAPAPAGGNTDLYARLIAQLLSERMGQTFFVENRPGAGSNIGTEAVVRAAPDGYTLLQVSSQNAWAVGLYDKNFDLLRDLSPVASIYRAPGVLVVHPSFPAKSVPELIAYAKANPGKINMASGGVASTAHVYGEMFKMMASLDMLHVPYRGGGQPWPTFLQGMYRSCSTQSVPQSSISKGANYAHWQLLLRHARK
jgi:tripartite-type tricarboxylate transporter receptor subunit TctC